MLKHIGLTLTAHSEIENFYQALLHFKQVRHFQLSEQLSERLFGQAQSVNVYQMMKNGLVLELFVSDNGPGTNYNHLCIAVADREQLIQSARQKGYDCTVVEREKADLVFLSDHSVNRFEITP